MKQKLKEILNTKVHGRSIERYFADVLAEAEKESVNYEKVKMQNAVLKQWNAHHNAANASYRIEVRDKELVIDAQKNALRQYELSQKD